MASDRRWRRVGRSRGERGAALVEFAIVFPVLALVVFGIIQFGSTYNNYEAVRQGVRDAARQGVVGQYGANTSCGLTGLSTANTQTQQLMCLTKSFVGLGNATRVKVLMIDNVTAPPNGAMVVCAQYPQPATSGLMDRFMGQKILHTQVQMRIEKVLTPAPVADGETAPNGGSWSWCTAS